MADERLSSWQMTVQVQAETRGAVPEDMAGFAAHRVSSLLRVASEPVLFARVKLIMSADPAVERPAIAQVSIDLNGRLVRAQAAGGTMREAVEHACDRLRIRLGRAARDWEAVRGGRPVAGPGEWRHQSLPAPRLPYFPRPPGERTIVRHKSYALARQTPAEAAAEAELLDYDFHLFTEKSTGEDSVIWRTADGYRLALAHPADPAAGPGRPVDHRPQDAGTAPASGRGGSTAGGRGPALPVLRQRRNRSRQPDLLPLRRPLRSHRPCRLTLTRFSLPILTATSGAASGTLLSWLWQGEAVPAVEPDEAGRGDDPHPPQAVLLLLIQDDIFPAPGADRLDQAPPRPELGGQR